MNTKINKFLQNDLLITIISFVYNIVFSKMILIRSQVCQIDIRRAFIRNSKVKINGIDNKIIIGQKSWLKDCKIIIIGNGNQISINSNCRLSNVTLWIEDDCGKITIDSNTTMEGGSIAVSEGTEICIGKDCMLSYGIDIRSGDSHGIFTMDGQRINQSENISIGNHVWIGADATILKGSKIPSGSVIGHSSFVCSILNQTNSIYAGMPATLKKTGIKWSRQKNILEV